MLVLGTHSTVSEMSISEFHEASHNADNWVVFFVDTLKPDSGNEVISGLTASLEKTLPQLKFVRVDHQNPGTFKLEDDALFDKHSVFEYPSAKLFKKGIAIHLEYPAKEAKLVKQINSKLGNTIRQVNSIREAEEISAHHLTIFYSLTDSGLQPVMEGLAAKYHQLYFIKTTAAVIKQLLTAQALEAVEVGGITLVTRRNTDSHFHIFNPKGGVTDAHSLSSFIFDQTRINWMNYTERVNDKIKKLDSGVVLFYYDQSTDMPQVEILKKAIRKQEHSLFLVLFEKGNQQAIEYLEMVGFPTSSVPGLFMMVKTMEGKVLKHKFNQAKEKISQKTVREFTEDCLENMYPIYYKSEEVAPATALANVEVLIGKTILKKVIENSDDHHVVFFYDEITEKHLPAFDAIAGGLKHQNLKFYVMNMRLNEHPKVGLRFHGKIVLYSGGSVIRSEERL